MRRARLLPASLAGGAVVAAAAAVAVRGGPPAPLASTAPPLATATVVRTNLATSVLTPATLGYAPTRPVIDQLAGTYTWLPRQGARIRPGQTLFKVDQQPVVLMRGRIPAWRPFTAGMAGGRDVAQLQANLIRLGYAAGLLTRPTGQFDALTGEAVARWQRAAGLAQTGQIPFGRVVFLPSAIRAEAATALPGQPASPGQAPYAATTDHRIVQAPDSAALPPAHEGERVRIIMPSGAAVPGRVASIGPPAATGAAQATSGGPTTVITVRPLRPRATGTASGEPAQLSLPSGAVHDVLAVPVTALLALRGGGYGVEVVTRRGHRLIRVRAGLFAAGRVAVTGHGLAAGQKVVTAQ